MVGSVAYTVFVWSRLSARVELSTRYTTPNTTVEIGNTSATVGISVLNHCLEWDKFV